ALGVAHVALNQAAVGPADLGEHLAGGEVDDLIDVQTLVRLAPTQDGDVYHGKAPGAFVIISVWPFCLPAGRGPGWRRARFAAAPPGHGGRMENFATALSSMKAMMMYRLLSVPQRSHLAFFSSSNGGSPSLVGIWSEVMSLGKGPV